MILLHTFVYPPSGQLLNSSRLVNLHHQGIPKIASRLDPKLDSHICCPSCFTLYEPEDASISCTYRKSARSPVCEEAIFTRRTSAIPIFQPTAHSSRPCPPPFHPFTPCLVYHMQKFATWLKGFLNVPGTEKEIDFWKEKVKSTPSSDIVDIHQLRAWKCFSVRADQQLFCNEI
ncbi:hypothetical protein VP01_3931g1 [Puccinia sorghi]|uniref:Uncharacterized protein n=1 Tax=Puccinia sorghi TaxID=27349 RepID=A0A0L6UUF3_9BASI|nr:hypothetical protein VP01_3931g1 [Puccinia sorghi]